MSLAFFITSILLWIFSLWVVVVLFVPYAKKIERENEELLWQLQSNREELDEIKRRTTNEN